MYFHPNWLILFGGVAQTRQAPKQFLYFWVNFNDHTTTEPWESLVFAGKSSPFMAEQFRVVNYYDIPRNRIRLWSCPIWAIAWWFSIAMFLFGNLRCTRRMALHVVCWITWPTAANRSLGGGWPQKAGCYGIGSSKGTYKVVPPIYLYCLFFIYSPFKV